MAGRYPKPDGQKVNRTTPTFAWVNLPRAGRPGRPPALPGWRVWQPATKKWWAELWAKPQAIMWDPTGESLWPFAAVMDDLFAGRDDAVKLSPEIRQHQDRLGLNPKSMLQLRWRIPSEDEVEGEGSGPPTPIDRRRKRLKVV